MQGSDGNRFQGDDGKAGEPAAALDRRAVFGLGAGAAALGLFPSAAFAQADPRLSEVQVLDALDNALWVPDGPASDRHVYVIYAPWCGACQTLYNQTRRKPAGLQLRWIATNARDPESASYIAFAGSARTPTVLDHTFAARRTPAPVDLTVGENIIRINFWAGQTAGDFLEQQSGRRFAFPGVVIPSGQGLRVLTGAQPLAVLNQATARPGGRTITPTGVGLAAQTRWRSDRPRARSAFAKPAVAYGRALPSLSAPVVKPLANNRGGTALSVATVDGVQWVELQLVTGRGVRGVFYQASDLFFQ